MGYFALPPKTREECSPQELIQTAIKNINLFVRTYNGDSDYLLTGFATSLLEDALNKLNVDNG